MATRPVLQVCGGKAQRSKTSTQAFAIDPLGLHSFEICSLSWQKTRRKILLNRHWHSSECWRCSGEQNRHRPCAHGAKLLLMEMTLTKQQQQKQFQRTKRK